MVNRFSKMGLSLVLVSGCFYPAERGRLLEVKVEKLASENAELTQQLQTDKPRMDQKLAEVTHALASLDQASRRSGADIGVQLQKTIEDVAQLRGQVDGYVHTVGELDAKIAALQQGTDDKLAGLQGQQARKDADAKREADKLVRPKDKREFFALADEKAKAGELDVARQLFREFVKKWPKDDLAAESYFAIGETYFSHKSCDEALPEYGKVAQDFPRSRSAPMALVRSSDCFKALGKPTEARYALEEVLKSYPKADAARIARTKLADLAKARKPTPRKAAR